MGVFLVTDFISQKVKVLSGFHLKLWKYNVWGIKLATKVMRLLKIQVEKISLLLLNKNTVHNNNLLCMSSASYTCSLRCIIPSYCISHSLDKHNF